MKKHGGTSKQRGVTTRRSFRLRESNLRARWVDTHHVRHSRPGSAAANDCVAQLTYDALHGSIVDVRSVDILVFDATSALPARLLGSM